MDSMLCNGILLSVLASLVNAFVRTQLRAASAKAVFTSRLIIDSANYQVNYVRK